jgi:hypothetical protein
VVGLHQFLEWPEAAAPRVTPGPSAAADVGRILIAASDQATWSDRREAARAAYLAAHRPPQVAAELTRFLKSIS